MSVAGSLSPPPFISSRFRIKDELINVAPPRPPHKRHSQRPPQYHYNRPKTNMRHIHTSIVSRHLAARGNKKILRTPPPHIIISKEILPRLTRRTLRTNKSPFLKSYLHKVDAKSHPSPLCPLCSTHTHDPHHLFNCTHIRATLSPLDLWTDPAGVTALLARWTEKLAGGPQVGRSDSPPLAMVMGVGRL